MLDASVACIHASSFLLTEEAAAADPPLTPQDSFCTLLGDNLGQNSQALDDWRLQLLELLPAAKVQLSEAQVCTSVFQPPSPLALPCVYTFQ